VATDHGPDHGSRAGDADGSPVLSARDVETGYGDLQVVFGASVTVRPGEVVMLFGPNGSGKSTFVRAVYGLLPLWEGRVTVAGHDVSSVPAEDRPSYGLAYVPQTENVFPNLTVAENLDMGGLVTDDPDRRRDAVFELFPDLADIRDQRASSLSGGQRQMLAMGLALMADPEVLLIDEPSAGLAPALVERAFEHIETVAANGTAVLMIEQNVEAGLAVADRGYALDGGEIRFDGPAAELLDDDEVRDLYLGT